MKRLNLHKEAHKHKSGDWELSNSEVRLGNVKTSQGAPQDFTRVNNDVNGNRAAMLADGFVTINAVDQWDALTSTAGDYDMNHPSV